MDNSLKPCPFCGEIPIMKEASWTGIEYIKCDNKKCLVRPHTYGDINIFNGMSREEAREYSINLWNTRI